MKRGKLSKKSQVTIFIIIAVVILAIIVLLVLFFRGKEPVQFDVEHFEQAHVKSVMDNIESATISCMEEKSMNALDTIGIQGGYYDGPNESFDMGWAFIPYYFYEGQIFMPSRARVQQELANYVDDTLKNCIDSLKFENFDLVSHRPKTKVNIKPKEVDFVISMDIGVTHENKKTTLELKEIPVSHYSFLYEILEVATYVTNSHAENPDMICINCVADMAYERELYVDFLEFDGDTETLVVISENKTRTEPYIFEFLNRYLPEEGVGL